MATVTRPTAPADLPVAWNDAYRHDLGIVPRNDAEGCLQDGHWGAGLFGYFPTYTLGNLYAAQFFEQADRDLGGLRQQFARGEFMPLREWLRDKIHRHGSCYTAPELIERVTGRPLSHEPLMAHLYGKLGPLYGIKPR
jgi:carboxypeptidase Taq